MNRIEANQKRRKRHERLVQAVKNLDYGDPERRKMLQAQKTIRTLKRKCK